MTNEYPRLPDFLQDKAASMPEDTYGSTRVIIQLKDGREIGQVHVAWGREIVKVGSRLIRSASDLPFEISDIADIKHQET